ncbi:BTB/POZ domain-containing protein, partial [Aphelenchoides avenae]
MSVQNRQHGTLALTIYDAKEYFREDRGPGNRQHSLPVTLCGLEWQIEARRELCEGVPYANVYVICSTDQPTWKCKATCAIRIRSSKEDRTWRFCGDFSEKSKTWGTTAFITIEDLVNTSKGYLNDDGQIIIACTISAFLPSTCEAADGLRGVKRRCTDVKVVIGDRHVYVNRGKEEIALEDVHFDDFTTFLDVVYPPHKAICAENIAAVMPLADRFGAKIIIEQCEQFLVDDMDLSKAIPILEKCSLDELK